jgi:hypothetical protein
LPTAAASAISSTILSARRPDRADPAPGGHVIDADQRCLIEAQGRGFPA